MNGRAPRLPKILRFLLATPANENVGADQIINDGLKGRLINDTMTRLLVPVSSRVATKIQVESGGIKMDKAVTQLSTAVRSKCFTARPILALVVKRAPNSLKRSMTLDMQSK